MIRRLASVVTAVASILISWIMLLTPAVQAQEKLRYSCSSQVYEAFEKERLELFSKATGIEVELYVSSSSVAVNRLMSGQSDIASMARGGDVSPEGGRICGDTLWQRPFGDHRQRQKSAGQSP